jgi:nucleoid DNA-binding protein
MGNPEIDRTDISYVIAERSGISPVEALESLKHLGPAIAGGLVSHNRVEIHGVGTFRLEKRAARRGILNGAEWETPERQEIVFEAWPTVAQIVADRTGVPTY